MDEKKEVALMNNERSVAEVRDQVNKIQKLMTEVMQVGQHFGTVPGCGDKPTLLKPGAEKLCFTFRVAPEFQITRDDLANGHREYQIVCRLRSMTSGEIVGEGVGSASTMETKYRWRNQQKKCPACGKETIIKGKAEYGGGWVCLSKKGGCGAKYDDDAPEISAQAVGKVENPDIADTYNTVLKIAKKRAHVDATITAFAASDIFTQDVEDFASDQENVRYAEDAEHHTAPPKPAQTRPAAKTGDGIDWTAKAAELTERHQIDNKMKAAIWKDAGCTAKAYCEMVEKLMANPPAPAHQEPAAEGNGDLFGDPAQDMIVELEGWMETDSLPAVVREDIRATLESGEKDIRKLRALLDKVIAAAGQ